MTDYRAITTAEQAYVDAVKASDEACALYEIAFNNYKKASELHTLSCELYAKTLQNCNKAKEVLDKANSKE